MNSLSRVRLFVTPWTVAYQAPPSTVFSKQECWSGLPFPSPGDLPDPGIEPGSPALQADALPSEPPGKPMMLKVSCYKMSGKGTAFFKQQVKPYGMDCVPGPALRDLHVLTLQLIMKTL